MFQSSAMPNILGKVFGATMQHYEVKRIKSWMNRFRSRRFIEIGSLLNNDRKLPTSQNLIIRINQLQNIAQLEPQAGTTQYMQLNATLAYCQEFPAKQPQKRGQQPLKNGKVHFFGRTYSSKLQEVKIQQNMIALKQPHYLYVNVTQQIQNLSLVIEVVITRTNEQNVIVNQEGVGWLMISNILNQGAEVTINLRNSTPRMLLHDYNGYDKCKMQEGIMKVKVQKSSKFYLPMVRPYTLIGPTDEIPGIQDQQLPPNITSNTQLRFCKCVNLFIQNGVITLSKGLEETLLRTIKNYREMLYKDHQGKGMNKQQQQYIEITERRLIVGAHNTWDYINKNGNKNYIAMSPPDPNTNKSNLAGILKVEQISMAQDVALIFKLQYSVKIKSHKSGNDYLTFVLGWLIHIPSVNHIGQWSEKQISCEFIMGPGVTITGDMLWDANYNVSSEHQQRHYIHLNAFISKSDQIMPMPNSNMMMESQVGHGNQLSNQQQRNYQNIIKEMQRKTQQSDALINRQKQIIENQGAHTDKQTQALRKQMQLMRSHYDDGRRQIDQAMRGRAPQRNQRPTNLPSEVYDDLAYNRQENRLRQQFTIPEESYQVKKVARQQHTAQKQMIMSSQQILPLQTDAFTHHTNIERNQIGYLAQAGIKNVGEGIIPPVVGSIPISLQAENQDPNKGTRFLIRILSYRPGRHLSSHEIPRALYFTFKFFDRPQTRTDIVQLHNPQNRQQFGADMFYPLKTIENRVSSDGSLQYVYDIDPSKVYRQNVRFIQYLLQKYFCIQVWNATDSSYIGIVQIPLVDWMRQGKQVVNLGRNYSIFDPFLREQMGNLTIEMTNQGRSVITMEQKRLQDVDMKQNGYRLKKDGTQSKTKKKIKSKPINLADQKYRYIDDQSSLPIIGRVENQENYHGQNMELPEDIRKKQRVEQYKWKTGQNSTITKMLCDPTMSDPVKEKALRDLQQFKDTKVKPYVISQALKSRSSNAQIFAVQAGQPTFFIKNLTNMYTKPTNFDVQIQDPLSRNLQSPFELVRQPSQWEFLCKEHVFTPPPTYNMITANRTINVHQKETVPLLFKFFTDGSKPQALQGRIISVKILQKNGPLVDQFDLQIEPHDTIVDTVYRINQSENDNIEIRLPFIPPGRNQFQDLKFLSSKNNVKIKQDINRQQLILSTRTQNARNSQEIQQLLVFVYSDRFYSTLVKTLKLSIRLFQSYEIEAKAGLSRLITLHFNNDKNRRLQFISSNTSIAKFYDEGQDIRKDRISPKTVVANETLKQQVYIQAFAQSRKSILISMIDSETRQIIHGWLIKLKVNPCEIDGQLAVDLKNELNKSYVKFEFRNPTEKRARFFAASSDERFMKVARQSQNGLLLDSRKLGEFILSFPSPDSRAEEIKTYLFIRDQEDNYHRTIEVVIYH